MGTSLPVGWAADTNDTPTATPDTTTVGDAKVDASNLSDENKTAWRNALGVGTITSGTYTTDDTTVAGNLSKLDTQVKKNAADLSTLSNTVSTNNTDLNTKITSITSDITRLEDLSNITPAGKKVITGLSTKITQGDRVTVTPARDATTGQMTYTISVNNDGKIESGNTNLVSGGTMYTELRPTSGKYISAGQSTAANLISLDQNLLNVVNALGLDADDTSKSYTSKLNKYFKVNPKSTTTDGTTTYDPEDAAANGTNSVAIGPSAQAGEKTTDTTTVTGGTSSTAIGDSAKANGDQSVALGYGSKVLNASGSTKAVSGSTAIGSGAKVEGGSDSTALGSGATVDTASNAMALGKNATINKTSTSGVAIGNGAVTGSADKTITVNNLSYDVKAAGGVDSVAIGTDASSAGSTSIALGKGATVENDSDGNYQAVVKSDDIAIGTDAKTSASDFSTAIGKGSSVTQSTDALAVGSGAKVTTSKNAMAFGKGADAESAADSIAMGTSAKTISADTIAIGQNTSAEGANSVVIGKGAATTVEGGNAIGSGSAASGSSTAIGQSATANNYNALAIGNNATANADKSISLGYNAGVGTSEGKGETQNAGSLIAIGTSAGNNVLGMQNVAIGESAGSNVKSSYNVAIGSQAGYGINYASDDKSQNGFNVSVGYRANYQENSANIMYATALGNEANASNYSVAIGNRAKAGGAHTVAIGEDAQTSDASSIALGPNASAADGNIAIGNGSSAPAVSTLGTIQAVTVDGKTVNYVYDANGNQFRSAFTYKPLQADSHYISVGNSTLTRRISNVADGVFASDAATVGQLNSLNELLQATDTKVGLTKDYFEQKFTNLNTTIDASKTHYFSISESSDNLSANKDNTGATSNKADAMAIGPNANATNVKSLAVGNNVYATGLRSIAIGTAPNPTKDAAGTTTTHNTSAEGENSIALGTSTTAQADNSVAIGTRAQAYTTDTDSGKTGARSVAIGNLATTAGNQSVALGYDATVKYDYGTAIGSEALASGTDAVAVGKGSKAYSTDSTAIGQGNSITGNNVYGLGSSNAVSGKWGAVTQGGISGYQNTITSVSDKDGNSLTQHATEIRIHNSNAKADDTTTDVVLKKDGLHNGGHTITGVADGQLSADSKEAVNGSQLYALQQKVTNGGWDIIGDNENKSTHIGNDKTVSFKSGKNSTVSVTGTDTGAEVKVDVNTAQISTNDAHQATVTGTGLADAKDVVQAINSAAWNVQKKDGTVQQVKAGDTVTFDAGNNIVLAQNDKSFTYGLASDVNTNSIRLGGSQDINGDWTGGIFIGKQIGGGANQNEGNYITGLANTSWDLSKVVDNRAATEAQLKEAINQITLKEQNGGFALKDESGNEKGRVSQTLGNAIAIVGDTEYESDGKTVKKAGNITTEADGTNVGGIKVKLNKNLDLSDEGSLRIGSSKVSNGAIQLGEDASANKILMDSTNGTASIGGVTVNGAKKTVNGLSNTKWTGTAVDGQAATENQLVEAINEAKTQAANSELHIKKGVYAIGKDSKGQEITDKVGKNSVSIDVVNATGTVDGQVVINDVAKASELGTVGDLADNLKNPAGGSTTVVQAVNKVNQKIDESLTKVNGDISNAVTEARKHTEVKSVDSDNNVTIDGTTTNAAGGTVYKLGLNKEHLNLGNVHIDGNKGRVTAKTVEAEMVKIDDQTRLDKTGLTTGNTTVADGRVVVGGDNGIKIEAKGDQ